MARVLYRSSFVVVVDVGGQWCTHFYARNNRRLVAIRTTFARLPKFWRIPRFLDEGRRHETIIKFCHVAVFVHTDRSERGLFRASQCQCVRRCTSTRPTWAFSRPVQQTLCAHPTPARATPEPERDGNPIEIERARTRVGLSFGRPASYFPGPVHRNYITTTPAMTAQLHHNYITTTSQLTSLHIRITPAIYIKKLPPPFRQVQRISGISKAGTALRNQYKGSTGRRTGVWERGRAVVRRRCELVNASSSELARQALVFAQPLWVCAASRPPTLACGARGA